MRRATALEVIIRLSWFNSIHFDAIHSWNLSRSHKLEKSTKTPIFEIQGLRLGEKLSFLGGTLLKSVHWVLVFQEPFLPILVLLGLFVFALGGGTGRTDGRTDRPSTRLRLLDDRQRRLFAGLFFGGLHLLTIHTNSLTPMNSSPSTSFAEPSQPTVVHLRYFVLPCVFTRR